MSHSRIGCFGFIAGSLVGLLVVVLYFVFLGQQAILPGSPQAVTPSADITLFLSERTLSRLASATLQKSVALDFEPGGRIEVTLPVKMLGQEPVVRLGLSLERQGAGVVSQLHWAKVGLLKLPADRLPAEVVDTAAQLGTTITQQIPPELTLVGLTTTATGLYFHLNWTPPAGQ